MLDRKTRSALAVYEMNRITIALINEKISGSNQRIQQVKEDVKAGKLESIANELSYLRAIESRYSPENMPLCEDYLAEKNVEDRH